MILTPEQEKLVNAWRNSPKTQRDFILNEKPRGHNWPKWLGGPNEWNEAYTAVLALMKSLSPGE